jgi:hypothetical protein
MWEPQPLAALRASRDNFTFTVKTWRHVLLDLTIWAVKHVTLLPIASNPEYSNDIQELL